MNAPRSLGFLDPGHFHAALTLRRRNPRVRSVVHLYAAESPERAAFLSLVDAFNARRDAPTDWRIRIHAHADPLLAMARDGLVDAAVLAGRNACKLRQAAALHQAGIAVLADKPWLTHVDGLAPLAQVTAGPPLAMDIMTGRFDVLARLRARLVRSPRVFGELVSDAGDIPAIEIGSVHHLYKRVDGRALIRPPWYYDVDVQGDGLVDIQSHMVDQMQWLVGEPTAWSLAEHVSHLSARHWSTAVDRALFRDSTGLDAFPSALADRIHDGVLHLACNSEIRYRLRGVPVLQRAEWREREPERGGDLHLARLRGSLSEIVLEHGANTGYQGVLHVRPRDGVSIAHALEREVAAWQSDFPGLGVAPRNGGFQLIVPPVIRTSHESHFPMVLDAFLDLLDADEWPASLAARIRMRYGLLASALQVAAP